MPFEEILLYRIHSFSTPFLDRLFILFTRLGSTRTLAVIYLAAGLILFLNGRRREIRWTALLGIGTWSLEFLVKHVAARARPHLWVWIYPAHGYSLPSGHSTGSAALGGWLAWLLAGRYPRRRKIIYAAAGVVIFLIGLSRLYLGVHWPTDVLGGWILGLGTATLAAFLSSRCAEPSR